MSSGLPAQPQNLPDPVGRQADCQPAAIGQSQPPVANETAADRMDAHLVVAMQFGHQTRDGRQQVIAVVGWDLSSDDAELYVDLCHILPPPAACESAR
ncbi:MAG: hypothetical protein ABIP48_00230 [Planctomycetota bacterium]